MSLDLAGLPPSPPPEIAEFIRDNAPNACEKVVDRLLASRAFGEPAPSVAMTGSPAWMAKS